jgi:hypothetical protein
VNIPEPADEVVKLFRDVEQMLDVKCDGEIVEFGEISNL